MSIQNGGRGTVVSRHDEGGIFAKTRKIVGGRRGVWARVQTLGVMDKTIPSLVLAWMVVGVGASGCAESGSRPAPAVATTATSAPAEPPSTTPAAAPEVAPSLVVAAAQPASPGKEQAMRVVCAAGLVDGERARCGAVVSRANYIDPLAVDVCASIVAPEDRIACAQAIANRYYTITETRLCTRAVVASDRLACLRAAGSTRPPTARDEGRSAASDVCATLREVGERQRCIEVVAPAKVFAKDAVRVCSGLLASPDKIACLGKVRDRTYGAKDVPACQQRRTVSERLDCLATTGRSAELARAMK